MNSSTEIEQPIICNDFITCYSDRLIIHYYYFPYGDKIIKYSDIKSCELLKIHDISIFQRKIWGMALSPVWWHSDLHRNWREYYILIDANQWPKIGITMNDSDIHDVYNLIKENMDINQSSKVSSVKVTLDGMEDLDDDVTNSMLGKKDQYKIWLKNNVDMDVV